MNQAAELARLTGMHYFFAKGIDFLGGEYGIAVLSKYPFLKTQRHALPMKAGIGGEPRALAWVVVEPVKGKKLIFANTHMDLHEENRLLQADYIVNLLKEQDAPVVFCGDLNAEPGSEVIKKFQTILDVRADDGPTYPQISPQSRLDYIMYSKGKLRLVKQELIMEEYASDHWPVYAELAW